MMQVEKQSGGIQRVSLRVAGEGHVLGKATCSGGGNDDAVFMLTPSTKSQDKSMLQKLGLVLKDVRRLLESRQNA